MSDFDKNDSISIKQQVIAAEKEICKTESIILNVDYESSLQERLH